MSTTPFDPSPERAPRYDLRTPVDFKSDAIRGNGTVWDMSESGALIEQVFFRATPGTRLSMAFNFPDERTSLALFGEVVRSSESGGFAVSFSGIEAEDRTELAKLLPRVGTPRR